MILFKISSALLCILLVKSYDIDDSTGFGRVFDGIGGLSGGGATSKLLVNYSEPERSQILDYLFKPNFGASLHILKVEIGGDSQSTEGTESSHMHNASDLNFHRGYEWWLMKEAKARNPHIKLYGLSWAFPGWLGKGSGSPYTYPNLTANYILKWVEGAKSVHGLSIDYLGIWNERPYNSTYIETLRSVLNDNGHSDIKIVAPDGNWGISDEVLTNAKLRSSFDIIGAHYPGTTTTNASLKTTKPLWSSEDYSTLNDNQGAGCWARILNQNYVTGYMTSTISWNLIASYYPNLPYDRCGLMTAMEPWSGHYIVESPIWVSAHTTQFTEPGMVYLNHGSGVGYLDKGGSYVTLVHKQMEGLVTLVIETMSHNHSRCIRPFLPPYQVSAQTATFTLKGTLKSKVQSFHVWYTKLGFDGVESTLFKHMDDIKVDQSGSFSVQLGVDEVWTLSTVYSAVKGGYSSPPPSSPFPLPYTDNFTDYPLNSEDPLFVPQVGVWEIRNSSLGQLPPTGRRNQVNTQVVTEKPINWCGVPDTPINLGGNFNWSDIYMDVSVSVPENESEAGVFLALRVDKSGCGVAQAKGLFFWLYPNTGKFVFTTDLAMKSEVLNGKATDYSGRPAMMSLLVYNDRVMASINQQTVFTTVAPSQPANGFVAYGTTGFFTAEFDDVFIDKSASILRMMYRNAMNKRPGDAVHFSKNEKEWEERVVYMEQNYKP